MAEGFSSKVVRGLLKVQGFSVQGNSGFRGRLGWMRWGSQYIALAAEGLKVETVSRLHQIYSIVVSKARSQSLSPSPIKCKNALWRWGHK